MEYLQSCFKSNPRSNPVRENRENYCTLATRYSVSAAKALGSSAVVVAGSLATLTVAAGAVTFNTLTSKTSRNIATSIAKHSLSGAKALTTGGVTISRVCISALFTAGAFTIQAARSPSTRNVVSKVTQLGIYTVTQKSSTLMIQGGSIFLTGYIVSEIQENNHTIFTEAANAISDLGLAILLLGSAKYGCNKAINIIIKKIYK